MTSLDPRVQTPSTAVLPAPVAVATRAPKAHTLFSPHPSPISAEVIPRPSVPLLALQVADGDGRRVLPPHLLPLQHRAAPDRRHQVPLHPATSRCVTTPDFVQLSCIWVSTRPDLCMLNKYLNSVVVGSLPLSIWKMCKKNDARKGWMNSGMKRSVCWFGSFPLPTIFIIWAQIFPIVSKSVD